MDTKLGKVLTYRERRDTWQFEIYLHFHKTFAD